MKKFIVCLVLVFTIILGLCACTPVTFDEGAERKIYNDTLIEIEHRSSDSQIVYDKNTKIVYYLETAENDGGYLSPYLIYQDGYIYGAIFQDGEIIPVPYASVPLK